MNYGYVIKTLVLCSCAFLVVYCGFLSSHYLKNKAHFKLKEEIKDNDYYKKINLERSKFRGYFDHLTRVEVSINDEGFTPKGRIVDVTFNDEKIMLTQADSRARRGSMVFQLKPNIYIIRWVVQSSCNPPTFVEHKKEINITDADIWKHIHIKGSSITFN